MKYKKGAYMANQKLETLLNVSMQATKEDRAKSPDLSAGVDEEAGIWEIIVKYTQDLSQFSENIRVWKYMNYWVDMQLYSGSLGLFTPNPQPEQPEGYQDDYLRKKKKKKQRKIRW